MRRQIGKTGVEVFAIGLGAMPLSTSNRPSTKEAIKVIHAALDHGVDFIDTANVYCLDDNDIGHNERLIAEALKTWPGREKIYVATKGGRSRPNGAWELDGEPKKLRLACEKSLRDCGVDQIFLYQLHAPDDRVPFGEQIEALRKLQEEGKIKHIGISNVDVTQIEHAQKIARIETVQNLWNPLAMKDAKNGVQDACVLYDMTYIAYSPVGGGRDHHELAHNPTLLELARAHNATTYQIILAWTLATKTNTLPIPGASRSSSIIDSVKAVNIKLRPEEMEQIDTLSVP